jgi:hypothetical protein
VREPSLGGVASAVAPSSGGLAWVAASSVASSAAASKGLSASSPVLASAVGAESDGVAPSEDEPVAASPPMPVPLPELEPPIVPGVPGASMSTRLLPLHAVPARLTDAITNKDRKWPITLL